MNSHGSLSRASFLFVPLYMTQMTTLNSAAASTESKTEYAVFRDFNSFVAEARVQYVEIRSNENGEFVTVTAITNLKDGTPGVAVRFSSSNGVLKLAKAGHLMAGRRIHVTGSVTGFETAYTNKEGVVVPLERGRLQLGNASLQLGAKPRSAM